MKTPRLDPRSILVILSILFCICGSRVFAEDVSPKEIAESRKAAEEGDVFAQFRLGLAYCKGVGVPKDDVEAVKWWRKAAEQGYDLGQVALGGCYRDGKGVLKNDEEAVKWYKKSASQGLGEAQRVLGYCYETGEGIEKNPVEATKWYRKAAEQGEKKAQCALGSCYVRGAGVPTDYVTAYMWYNLSAAAGYETAARFRDDIAKHMLPEQIAEAQKMSREWKPTTESVKVPDKAPADGKQGNAVVDPFEEP